jgi:hypothetical protein
MPRRPRELVYAITGLAAEQPRQFAMRPRQQMDGQMRRVLRNPVGVVLVGQADQEPRRPDADLAGEPHETARAMVADAGGDDVHRIVEH